MCVHGYILYRYTHEYSIDFFLWGILTYLINHNSFLLKMAYFNDWLGAYSKHTTCQSLPLSAIIHSHIVKDHYRIFSPTSAFALSL